MMGIGKNIFATLAAQLRGYVKLKQHHNPLKQLSPADTKPLSTLKYVITISSCFLFDRSPPHSIPKVSSAELFL